MTSDNPELDTSQQEGCQEDSETSGIESSQEKGEDVQEKTLSTTTLEKIEIAEKRISELQLLITHWKS